MAAELGTQVSQRACSSIRGSRQYAHNPGPRRDKGVDHMGRRPAPLDPEDGPLARFALELQRLRDKAGFRAMRIDAIAVRYGIARSTLYAVMAGRRMPSPPVLEALVHAWGGDPDEWVARRSATLTELGRPQDQDRRPRMNPQAGVRNAGVRAGVRRNSGMAALQQPPQAGLIARPMTAADGLAGKRGMVPAGPQYVEALTAYAETSMMALEFLRPGLDAQSSQATDAQVQTILRAQLWAQEECVRTILALDRDDAAEIWRIQLIRCGSPSQREISRFTGLRALTVSHILRGGKAEPTEVEALLYYLLTYGIHWGRKSSDRTAPSQG